MDETQIAAETCDEITGEALALLEQAVRIAMSDGRKEYAVKLAKITAKLSKHPSAHGDGRVLDYFPIPF